MEISVYMQQLDEAENYKSANIIRVSIYIYIYI